jgi:hypothetical protein
MEVSGHLHATVALLPRKEFRFPLDRRLGRPQSRSGCGGEEKSVKSKSLEISGNFIFRMYIRFTRIFMPGALVELVDTGKILKFACLNIQQFSVPLHFTFTTTV